MIYLRLHDRLGNILFMLAAALHLDRDVSVFASNRRDEEYVNKIINTFKLPVAYGVPSPSIGKYEYFLPTIYKKIPYTGDDLIIDGYFQSYRYFNQDDVRKLFQFPRYLTESVERKWHDVLSKHTTVSVHVRRGDYLNLPDRFPFVGKSYIRKAMKLFQIPDVAFIFTSDDVEWCKNNFKGDNIFYSEGENEYFDLCLASKCQHNILSNSTFSWWGAFLNENTSKRVVAPKRWYGPVLFKEVHAEKGELIPSDWSQIACRWDGCRSFVKAYYKFFRCNWRHLIPLRSI